MRPGTIRLLTLLAALLAATVPAGEAGAQQGVTGEAWPFHGGDAGFTRYAAIDQVDASNVHALEIAWRRPAVGPELADRFPDLVATHNLRSTPILVDGVLYASNGVGLVEAFHPGTGETVWVQQLPGDPPDTPRGSPSRTVGYWASEDGTDRRVLSVRGSQLLAVDARTGAPIERFGTGGSVDLRYFHCVTPFGRRLSDCDPRESNLTGPRPFTNFSGPLVVGNVVVVGSVMDNHPLRREMDPGDVRGYDVRTGHLVWTFRPVPAAGEIGAESWLDGSWSWSGKGNTWTLMSADPELGLVYLATGAPSNDMYGGHRPGENLFANSVVAVRASNGQRVWHFQTVRHDLWDYDNNAAPILVDVTVDGRPVRSLVQLTKQSMAYVLDRATGEPIWPMEDRTVPTSDTPGEWTSPTQPFPTRPAPFDLLGLTEDDLIDLTPELRAEALEIASRYRMGPVFTPPSPIGAEPGGTLGTLQMPGAVGGAEWGGGAFDPETGILYVPSITAAMVADLTRADQEGANVTFTRGTREMLAGPQGLPLTKPPWGRITAIDLNTGDHVWQVANGDGWRDHPAIAHLELPPLGQLGRAMPLLTRTLLFVSEGDPIMLRTPPGGGPDAGRGFRAFDKETGAVVWETTLPAGTTGAALTYLHEGRQYIVLPIGSTTHPGEWIALALPEGGGGGSGGD